MEFSAKVDGARVNTKLFDHRQLGFGEAFDDARHKVEFAFGASFFIGLLGAAYALYVDETRDDFDPLDADPLETAGYPPFDRVVESEELLAFVVQECLMFEFLEAIACSKDPSWVINSIESVACVDDTVLVFCTAFPFE